MTNSLKAMFHAGLYQEIVAEEAPGREDLVWHIGARAFVGRADEALLLFRKHQRAFSQVERAACCFFTGVGLTRISRYAEARQIFAESLLTLRATRRTSSLQRFYVFQGIAFFRTMGCRFGQASHAIERAWEAAILSEDLFAQVLATDLKGHTLVRLGEISRGLQHLTEARRLATALGNGGIVQAIDIAVMNYRAQFGIEPDCALADLHRHEHTLTSEDSYSQASLALELARQYTLRGQLRRAEDYLLRAEGFVFAHGHRRQKAFLFHRRAHNAMLKGQPGDALALLGQAEACLDPQFDLTLQLEIDGLRARVQQEQGLAPSESLRTRLQRLTVQTRAGVAWNIALRDNLDIALPPREATDDSLGRLLDTIAGHKLSFTQSIDAILRSGYLLFLPRLIGLRAGSQAVVLDPIPNALIVCDGGEISFHRSGCSGQIRTFCQLLAREKRISKEDLVGGLWGYRYRSDRHDTLVYALVNRLRRLLKVPWLRAEGGGYSLAPGVQIVAMGLTTPRPRSEPEEESALLNHRQRLLLETTSPSGYFSVQEVMERFEISKPTAVRDLQGLVGLGYLRVVGRARATRYRLVP